MWFWKCIIFNLALLIGICKSSYDNVLRWMPQDITDDKSTMVQVMAWCRQATSHYPNQCWPRSPTPYWVTRPQWVKVGRDDFYYLLLASWDPGIHSRRRRVISANTSANKCLSSAPRGSLWTQAVRWWQRRQNWTKAISLQLTGVT